MASGLEILRDKRLANGGYSNCNYQCPEDDPHGLIEEFCCLYSEKLKAIDEKYPDSLEPKCQALTELVTDLSEQNFMLLKTVEELEREALTRAEAFSDLAEAAKNTMQQDNIRRGSETKKSNELECKILELQAALTKNEANLTSCMLEIDQLTRSLQEKSAESEELQATHERMSELESLICSLQSDLQQKNFLTESLQRENCKLKEEACDFNKSVTESSNSVKWLEERLKEKEILLCQIINERDTLQLENQQMTLDLSSQYKRIEELDKEIECLKCLVQENEQKLRNRECELQNEMKEQSINNEKLTKALKDENNELKEQLDKLQNRLTASICQQTDGYTKDELIQSLQEDLCRSNCYLEKLQEEYTALKMEKIEIEEKNQKVMEELQAKICNLQASLQSQASEVDSMCKLTCIIEKQNQQLCQNEIIEKSLRQEIVCKEEEIKMGKSEIKAMKNRMNTVNCMFGELQVKFEKAKDIIAQLQDNRSEQEMEIKSLKNKLNAVEALYSEVKKNLECANEYLVQYQEKLAAVEHECNDLKFQIDFQQRGIEKMTQELREKSDQLCEIQQSNEMGRAAISRQFQSQLEANHWQTVSNKQKENLSDLIEENQYLKDENEEYRNELELNKSELCEVTAELVKSRQQVYQLNKCKEDYENDKTTIYCEVENTRKELCDLTSELDKCRQCILDLNRDKDDNENEKTVLFYELENTRKEFDQLTAELEASQQCIQELNQEKCILQNIAANLKKLLAEKRTLGTEYNLNQEDFSKNIMREQEKFIEILILKVAQMEKFLADKEEIITLLEAQLNTSTMLMMDNMDEYYEDESQLCVAVNNVENITSVTREAAYKMKLWQTLEINRRLVAMVNSLQHLNHSLLQDRR